MSESEIVIRELKRKEYQAALELYRKVFFREFDAPDDCVDEVYQGRMTVNSSHYAIPIYHRFGFHDTDQEQMQDGIRFTPMERNV